MNAQRFKDLLDTYLFVFDVFATSKSEVAGAFNISGDAALNRLKALEEEGLICRYALSDWGGMAIDSNDRNARDNDQKFKELTWQANQTYDDVTPSGAVANFLNDIQAPNQEALDHAVRHFADRGGEGWISHAE